MKFSKKIISLAMAVVMTLTPTMALYAEDMAEDADGSAAEAPIVEDEAPSDGVDLGNVKEAAEYNYNFELVAETSEARLLLDKKVNGLRVEIKATGKHFDTKVMNGQVGNATIKNAQKSDFVLTYVKDKVKANMTSMDSQSQSVEFEQVEYAAIDGGVRCVFTLGDAGRVKLTQFPMYISYERLDELVLQYLTEKQQIEFLKDYYTKTSTRVIRKWNTYKKDGTPTDVPIVRLKKMYEYFYEIGHYTIEELAFDNAEFNEPEFIEDPVMKLSVEYKLDGGDLVIRVPRDGMFFNPTQPFTSVTMNPYFISADFNDEGYLFIPDGTGGIIELNNGKAMYDAVLPVYGKDPLTNAYLYSEQYEQTALPVFGMVKNGTAVMGIIEEGAATATINANGSGRVDEFNKINVTFGLLYSEKVFLRGSTSSQTMTKYLNDVYASDIVTRYIFLDGDKATYTGMAKAYQNYLKRTGGLRDGGPAAAADAPFFVEIVGATPRQKTFLGIVYTEQYAMTTTKQAEQILSSLKSSGVKNITAQYTQWANGGMLNKALDSIKPISSIGGQKGLTSLQKYCRDNGITLYADAALFTTFARPANLFGTTKMSDVTRGINNLTITTPKFDILTRRAQGGEYLLNPSYWSGYAARVAKNYEKAGFGGISVNDAGTLLFGNYGKKEQITRNEALPYAEKAFGALDRLSVMFSGANAYAFKYAAAVTDLDSGSGRRVVDYYVPFTQMVLEGSVVYSLKPYNDDVMKYNGFEEYLLRAVESKSAMKLVLTEKSEEEFLPTYYEFFYVASPRFMTQFSRWENKIGAYYAKYNEFYAQVKDASIISHDVSGGAHERVKVGYSNGKTVYINYGEKAWEIDGVSVGGLSFIVR